MRTAKTVLAILSMVQVAALSLAWASDLEITFPSGWEVRGSIVHATSPTGSAIVLHQYTDADPTNIFDRSLVIQARPTGTTYETEFEGKVSALKYSPDGSRLLAHQVGTSDLTRPEIRAHLIDDEGTVLWSKIRRNEVLSFSTTGEVVYACNPGGTSPFGHGNKIEVFDLEGNSLKKVSLGLSSTIGVLVPGDGSKVIFASRRSVICLDLDSQSTAWRTDISEDLPGAIDLYMIDDTRFVAQLENAMALIINADGTLEYTFDPVALADQDGAKEPANYASYRMYPGPDPNTVSFFDGTSVTYTLELPSGNLTPRKIDVTRPLGSKIEHDFQDQQLFISTPTSVIVRTF